MNNINPNDKLDGEGSNQSINFNTYINFNEGAISVNNINIGLPPDYSLTPDPSPADKGNFMREENPKGRESKPGDLPESLATEAAMVLWRKAQAAGYINDNYQPTISRTMSAILADEMAVRLDITEKWKTFEGLWNRRNMYRDYYKALSQEQTLTFQDVIKRIFR